MRPEQLILTDTDNKDLQLISLLGESGLSPNDVVNAIVRIKFSLLHFPECGTQPGVAEV